MTKADLVEKVATHVNLTKKDTEVVIDTIFDSISQALAGKNDGKVAIPRSRPLLRSVTERKARA